MSQSNVERQAIETTAPILPHNLPAQLTVFVGRESESAQVIGLLRNPDCRLVSVIGAGGVGKTRLALEVAQALAHDPAPLFPDGIFAIPLAALTAREPLAVWVAPAIAGALGLTFSGPEAPAAQVRNYLRTRTMLLVLDNVEHLWAGTPFLVALLHAAPGLKLLATSRERLHIRGEWLLALDGLAYPDDRPFGSAVPERVEGQGRQPTTDNPFDTAQDRRQPTTDESVEDRRSRMEDRSATPGDLSSSTLDLQGAVVGGWWSVVELEQYGAIRLFVQTARMHTPGFALTAEVAPAVVRVCRLVAGLPLGIELAASWTRLLSCGEIAGEIAQNLDFLADAAPDLPARQQSLRAVFDYSWSLLAPSEQQTLRQLAVFRGSFTREAATSVVELKIENEESKKDAPVALPAILNSPFSILNLLAALVDKSLVRRIATGAGARYELLELLRQYAAQHLERAGEAGGAVARHAAYYCELLAARTVDLRGAGQQAALLAIGAEIDQIRAAWQYAVAAADAIAIERAADGLFHFYDMRSWFNEGAAAFAAARQALEARAADGAVARTFGRALAREGWFVFHQGRQHEARELLERSLAVLRAIDARADLVFTLSYLGVVNYYLGDYARTQTFCQESLALAQELGDLYGRAVACNILGQAAYDQGDYTAAQAWSQQSLATEQRIGNRWSMTYSLTTLGRVAYTTGAYDEARWFFEESLEIRTALNDTRGVAICLNRLGDTLAASGVPDAARERYDQSLRLFRSIGNQWGMASALINISRLLLGQGRVADTLPPLQEALRLALSTGAQPQVARIMAASAPLVRAGGQPAWAEQLEQLANSPTTTLESCREQAERLLAWLGSQSPAAAMSLEQALRETAVGGAAAAQAPASQRAAATHPAGLTAREVEVLRLVAAGLTDVQVAERLVVSPRTVQTHLSSIYGKLQVGSRSAATRFAVENGLV
jgi:predicted ATPase/DNA-binding CsgD family transcriptional regulator